MDRLMADLENGDVDLDKRLKAMGIDPKEFKTYGGDYTYNCCKSAG
jgi:hypothetical protein